MERKQPSPSQPLWLARQPLVLASASLTRLDMLAGCGVPADPVPAKIDERAAEAAALASGTAPALLAQELAMAKALEVSARRPGRLVLGADQTLTCNGESFHKPAGRAAARRQLLRLSGHAHELTSGFCLAQDNVVRHVGSSTAVLTMRVLSEDFVDAYLDAAGPAILGSVGTYQIEAWGSHLFSAIEGDHFTILGLPLLAVLDALRAEGVLTG